jgi:uncharacterized repeat protein (TIGR03803 family)
MNSARSLAVPTVRLSIIVLSLVLFSTPIARSQVPRIDQPHAAGAEARPASGVRPRRRNAKPQVQNGPETVLYTFQGGSDGGNPNGNLIFDSSGNLYGVTEFGGGGSCSTNGGTGCGTVFELSPNGSGGWTETILYSFQGGNDGAQPSAGLIFDQVGNLYGTTLAGGSHSSGTAFEVSPNGSGGWTESVLYSFGTNGGADDGEQPEGLVFDKSGNLYGPTLAGGNTLCDHDQAQSCGTVFELTPNGSGGWTETVIYTFPSGGAPGYAPNPGLIFDQSGNLYGTAQDGGAYDCMGSGGCGTVFEISPNGGGSWTGNLLYSFQGGSDGQFPLAGVTFDQSGNLYGTSLAGSGCNGFGCGTVFELSPNGSGGWTKTILYTFESSSSDGENPMAELIFDQGGNLYSTTSRGGGGDCFSNTGCGTVFELSPNGSGGWAETILYSFQGGADGDEANEPHSGVTFDQSGHLYGTTSAGGGTGCVNGYGCGVAFEISREPFAKLAPASMAFGNETVGITSSPQVATLTNIGNLPFNISSIQIGGANSSDFAQTNNCPSSLVANSSCTINVTFTPTALGSDSASLVVTDTAPGGTQTVALTGTGASFMVTITPSSVTFPGQYVGTSGLNQNVQLKNNGPGPLTIGSVVASPSSDFSQLSACGNSLAVGASCSIGVFFDPSTSGTRNGTLTITDNAPGSPQVVPLTGTGEDFSMSPTVPNQTVAPGQTASYSLTVMPEGGFKQTVQLSCSGAPTMSTCSVSPAAATLNGSTAQTVTVTVTTAGASAGLVVPGSVPPSVSAHSLWLPLSGALGLVGFVLPMRKRRFRRRGALFGLTLLCLLAVSMMPGCGGGTSSSGGSGTPAGTYNLTVTGSFTSGSSTLTHVAKLDLVVQ